MRLSQHLQPCRDSKLANLGLGRVASSYKARKLRALVEYNMITNTSPVLVCSLFLVYVFGLCFDSVTRKGMRRTSEWKRGEQFGGSGMVFWFSEPTVSARFPSKIVCTRGHTFAANAVPRRTVYVLLCFCVQKDTQLIVCFGEWPNRE